MNSDINQAYATVAIPTYNRINYLCDTLHSVVRQKTKFSYEILVLDNANDFKIHELVNSFVSESDVSIKYIPVPDIGLHNCRNIAAIKGIGQILVYIDDDVTTPENWLDKLILPFDDKNIVFVGGMTKPTWEATLPEWIDDVDKSFFSLLDLGNKSKIMTWPETPYGCNMAVRRDWVLELDGFSPDSMGSDLIEWRRGDGETGFAKKIYENEGKIYYAADAFLYHRIPSSRLTLSFVYKRAIKSVISSCYSEMREYQYSRLQLTTRLFANLYKSLCMLIKRIVPVSNKANYLSQNITIFQYLFKALYQARLLYDRDLREWVLKSNYMP